MTRRLLSTSLVLACLAGSALGGVPAALAKDPSLQFYPSEKWNVSAVKGKPGVNCTISSEFNNGFVVQFSGDSQNFTNINIDFRQDTFEKGKMYDVKLSVPGVSDATIPSKAFEKSVMVSDLRPYEQLSKALINANVLDFEIEGNAFRFYMTGLNSALKDHRQCTGDVPSEPVAAPQKLVLEEDKIPPVTPLPNLGKKSDERTASQIAKNVINTPKNDVEPSKPADLKTTSGEEKSLREKMAELAALDAGQEPAKNKPSKADEILSTAPSKPAEQKPVEPEPPKKQAPKVETVVSPPATITKSPPVKMEADFTKIDEKKMQEPSLKKELPPLKEAGEIPPPSVHPVDTEMRNKIRDLEKQVLKLQDENARLQGDLKDTLDDAREERLSVSSDNWNLERATMRFNEAERQIERLGRQLQTQKTQCDTEKRELEGMLFDPQVTNQQQLSKLSSLEEELDKARNDLLTQQRTYEERIKLLEDRLKQ